MSDEIVIDEAATAKAMLTAMLADLPHRARTIGQLCTRSPRSDALYAYSSAILVALFSVGSIKELEALRARLEEAHGIIKRVTKQDL